MTERSYLETKVIHPFLLAAYPLFFLYSKNTDRVSFSYVSLMTATVLLCVLVLLGMFRVMMKRSDKAGLVISLILLWVFFYHPFFEAGKGATVWGWRFWRHKFIFTAWTLTFGCFLIGLLRQRDSFRSLTKLFNVFSSLLISFCLLTFIARPFTNPSNPLPKNVAEKVSPNQSLMEKRLPDIYYIILDAYARHDILKKYYNLDTSDFRDYLLSKGFTIPEKSVSNYGKTYPSLMSSLSMDYIQDSEKITMRDENTFPPHPRIQTDNELLSVLRKNGYRFFTVGFREANADQSFAYEKDNHFLNGQFFGKWVEMSFVGYFSSMIDFFGTTDFRKSVLYSFDELKRMPSVKGPKFVFAHVLSPHPPYVFGPNGEPNSLVEGLRLGPAKLYPRQILFVNKKMREAIDTILESSEVRPIIIIQGDHGSRVAASSSYIFDSNGLEMLFSILNAYYFPDGDRRALYAGISPVNSFRIVLNQYFGQNYPLLKDESFLIDNGNFVNVTEKIQRR